MIQHRDDPKDCGVFGALLTIAVATRRVDTRVPELTYTAADNNDLAYGHGLDTRGDGATGVRRRMPTLGVHRS